jgi:hypothetical protein
MTIEYKNGGILIYTIKSGYLFKRFYMGYSKKEAVSMFKDALKEV